MSYHSEALNKYPLRKGTVKSMIHANRPMRENVVRTDGSRYHMILKVHFAGIKAS